VSYLLLTASNGGDRNPSDLWEQSISTGELLSRRPIVVRRLASSRIGGPSSTGEISADRRGFLAWSKSACVVVGLVLVALAGAATIASRAVAAGGTATLNQTAAADLQAPVAAGLGDSFSSGEGTRVFEPETDVQGRNECHRSPLSWQRIVASALRASLSHFACSGAETKHLLHEDRFGERAQITRLAELDQESPTQLVMLTIGGNDVGFRYVLQACLTPGSDCVQRYVRGRKDALSSAIAALPGQLVRVLGATQLAAPSARVLLAGYPHIGPLSPRSCLTASRAEVGWLAEKAVELNATLHAAATALDVEFVPMLDAFSNHDACRLRGSWVHGIDPFVGRDSLAFRNTFHPNARGYAVMARRALDTWHGRPTQPAPVTVGGSEDFYCGPVRSRGEGKLHVFRTQGTIACRQARAAILAFAQQRRPRDPGGQRPSPRGWRCLGYLVDAAQVNRCEGGNPTRVFGRAERAVQADDGPAVAAHPRYARPFRPIFVSGAGFAPRQRVRLELQPWTNGPETPVATVTATTDRNGRLAARFPGYSLTGNSSPRYKDGYYYVEAHVRGGSVTEGEVNVVSSRPANRP
jgi:lysophospholipase L1-like esterase